MEQMDEDEEEENNSDITDSNDDSSMVHSLAAKPTMTLLSDEAKMIFNSSSGPQRRSSGSNPRAHRIVETENGREYIPDTNSNNILALDGMENVLSSE